MNERGLLDLAIGRMTFLNCLQRRALIQQLAREEELLLLGQKDVEFLAGKPLKVAWDPQALIMQAEKDRLLSLKKGIAYLSYGSAQYPPLLRELHDPPTVLFYRGTLPDPELPMAAVVGTREPTGIGLAQAFEFGRSFARSGIPVVSGLARGIDALAHRGALDGGGSTIAVLGSGLDEVYPASNRLLARRIVESGGVLMSEYPPGTAPQKWHFPARNRIIAGLARATVVVEAPDSSGALITAQFALDLGRDLWVGTSCVSSPVGGGGRALAEQGARHARDAREIIEDWGFSAAAAPNEEGRHGE